jgi:hypothetical protein
MKPKLRRLTSLVVCVLLLVACEFQATTEVKPDGSGELRTEVGFTGEERKTLESQSGGSGTQNFCNSSPFEGQTSAEVTVTEEQRGDEIWCITTAKFDSLEDLRQLYGSLMGLTVNRLEMADGTFHYDIEVDTSATESSFSAFTAITWVVTMPGTPISHNAEQAGGNTLTWFLTPKSGTLNLQAESAVERSSSTVPLVIGGVMLLGLCGLGLLGGLGAIFLLRRSRQSSVLPSN